MIKKREILNQSPLMQRPEIMKKWGWSDEAIQEYLGFTIDRYDIVNNRKETLDPTAYEI